MNKIMKIVIAVVVLAIAAVGAFLIFGDDANKTNLKPIGSAEDLSKLVDEIYAAQNSELFSLETAILDTTDVETVKYLTGLENADEVEYLVVSQPMMISQAYTLVLAKVKEGVDASSVAKKMLDGVDPRRWVCVAAEKLYATNSGDVAILVMSNEEMAKSVYEGFKTLAGYTGPEYERIGE